MGYSTPPPPGYRPTPPPPPPPKRGRDLVESEATRLRRVDTKQETGLGLVLAAVGLGWLLGDESNPKE